MIKLKKKLIFINSFIYDKVMFEKFNFDNYINNSLIDTEFWRLNFDHVIDKKNFKEKNRLEHEEQELIKQKKIEKFRKIENLSQLIKNLKDVKRGSFIFDITLMSKNPLYIFLYKFYGAKLIFHGLAQFPIISFDLKDVNKILKKNFFEIILNIKKFLIYFFKRIINKLFRLKIDIFFYNGINEKKKSQKISKQSISLHTNDYDKFLIENAKNETRFIDENYILFLDMGYPEPHDNYFSLEKPVTSEENYKKGILKLFTSLNRIYNNKKIIVALHPKSQKENFYGYPSFKNITPKLIKSSDLILSHDSLSLQLAALWNKPTLMLFNNDMQNRISKFKEIKWFIDQLKLASINLDSYKERELKEIIERLYNKKKYSVTNSFVKKYINDGESENKLIPEIIIETIIKSKI